MVISNQVSKHLFKQFTLIKWLILCQTLVQTTYHTVFFSIYTTRITNFKCNFYGPTPQGEFLRAKGKNERAGRLKHDSSIQQISDIDLAAKRLIDRKKLGTF